MKRRLVRLALIGAALAAAGLLLAASGVIPLQASSGHWAITEWALRFGMRRSVATHSLFVKVPEHLRDPHQIQRGAGHYELACRACHGEPGGTRPRVAAQMLPPPPDLAERVPESSPRKLFHVVKHGLKFTGMPAWPSLERDDEVWAMVAFLLQYPELDADDYRELSGRNLVTAPRGGDLTLTPPPPPLVAQSCVRCHGADGLNRGNPHLPRLAGQSAAYLRDALSAYASGRRQSGIMSPVAADLTPEAIEVLADYYASLPPKRASPVEPAASGVGWPFAAAPDAAARARGERLAREGFPSERIPACLDCHGNNGRRAKPEYPRLAGQPAAYLAQQLELFREDRRGGADHAHLMQPIGARLTPEQAWDLAAYFASLDPEPAR